MIRINTRATLVAAGAAALILCAGTQVRAGVSSQQNDAANSTVDGSWNSFKKPSDQDLRTRLNRLQYQVTQENGTEPAFRNAFWDQFENGIYVDVVSGEPLFSSRNKFHSGTGWPSFTQPLIASSVVERQDGTLGMNRVEIRSRLGDSHLGHVFEDGPGPTGLRYCVNSASLRFIPVDRLEAEGYGTFLTIFNEEDSNVTTAPHHEVATLAGGCFWGMEDILRKIPGVVGTEVGYTGGRTQDPDYRDVSTGQSGHAEAIRVVFDPEALSFEKLLEYFFRMHDPTTEDQQGNDRGNQYRSAIFYHDDLQRRVAERVRDEVNQSGHWKDPVVTRIVPAGPFYTAEEYHQDYLVKNPGGYSCHYLRDWD